MCSVVYAGVRAALRVLAAEAALHDQPDEPDRSRGHRAILRDNDCERIPQQLVDRSPLEHPAHPADPTSGAHLPRAEARAPLDRFAGARLHVQQLLSGARPPRALPLHRRRQFCSTNIFRRKVGERQHVQLDPGSLLVL